MAGPATVDDDDTEACALPDQAKAHHARAADPTRDADQQTTRVGQQTTPESDEDSEADLPIMAYLVAELRRAGQRNGRGPV